VIRSTEDKDDEDIYVNRLRVAGYRCGSVQPLNYIARATIERSLVITLKNTLRENLAVRGGVGFSLGHNNIDLRSRLKREAHRYVSKGGGT